MLQKTYFQLIINLFALGHLLCPLGIEKMHWNFSFSNPHIAVMDRR